MSTPGRSGTRSWHCHLTPDAEGNINSMAHGERRYGAHRKSRSCATVQRTLGRCSASGSRRGQRRSCCIRCRPAHRRCRAAGRRRRPHPDKTMRSRKEGRARPPTKRYGLCCLSADRRICDSAAWRVALVSRMNFQTMLPHPHRLFEHSADGFASALQVKSH